MRGGAGGGKRADVAIGRHNDPGGDVGEQAQASAAERTGDDGQADQRDVDVKILGEAGADAGDFLVPHRAVQALGGTAGGFTFMGFLAGGGLVAALAAELVGVAALDSTISTVHFDCSSLSRYGRQGDEVPVILSGEDPEGGKGRHGGDSGADPAVSGASGAEESAAGVVVFRGNGGR
jgi:hypothetical protein